MQGGCNAADYHHNRRTDFQVKLSKAFRSGLTIGIGFAGINLVINMLKSNLGPAAQAMVENFGIKLDILDVGWGRSRQLHGLLRLLQF